MFFIGFVAMFAGVQAMAVSHLRMMSSGFVIAGGGMFSCFLMVFGCFAVMLRGF